MPEGCRLIADMFFETTYESRIFGTFTIASDGESVVGLWRAGQKYFGAGVMGEIAVDDGLPILQQAKAWLDCYFAGDKPLISELPLAPTGSDFRRHVWRVLTEIPYGQTRTYGDIAHEIACETGQARVSSQAVGGAVGHNPISIIVPCHRVIGADGSLTGYAGGIDTKYRLLQHEGVDMSRLHIPSKGTAL